jgi:hypothetical protein
MKRQKTTSIARVCEDATELTEMTISSRSCYFEQLIMQDYSLRRNEHLAPVLRYSLHTRCLTSNAVLYEVSGLRTSAICCYGSHAHPCHTPIGGFVLKYYSFEV